jgi:hypothetical protein
MYYDDIEAVSVESNLLCYPVISISGMIKIPSTKFSGRFI